MTVFEKVVGTAANQRTRRTEADGAYWSYSYDKLGQVTNGVKKLSDGTILNGQDYGYWFNDIGNRRQTTQGTNAYSRYYANLLNQYTSRTVPGVVDVTGSAAEEAIVTVNNQPTTRQREYFHKALSVPNETGTTTTPIHVVAVLPNAGPDGTDIVAEEHGEKTIPGTPEQFTYDDDGNMLSGGKWNYVWNGENRLVSASNSQYLIHFSYDHQGRRFRKVVDDGSTVTTNTFFYDGWNLVQEVRSQNSEVSTNHYTWGLDLSGSLQGAGGIGGLLAVSTFNVSLSTFHVSSDANGNITDYVSTNGTVVAHYEYGPFGETIAATGELKDAFKYRFSSKYEDAETGFLYYGYRYYSTELGRWPNRDPIGEDGGINLYGFIQNDAISLIDPFGLVSLSSFVSCCASEVMDVIANKYDQFSQETALKGNARRYCQDSCQDSSLLLDLLDEITDDISVSELASDLLQCVGGQTVGSIEHNQLVTDVSLTITTSYIVYNLRVKVQMKFKNTAGVVLYTKNINDLVVSYSWSKDDHPAFWCECSSLCD